MITEVLINNNSIPRGSSVEFINTATKAEENPVISVIMVAFSTDPAARWVYPDPCEYLTHFPRFIKAFAGKAFETGSAFYANDCAGAALWLPPDVHPDEEALIKLFEDTVSDSIKEDLFPVFEQMENFHPNEPHWYLPMIGVDTIQQNKGFGAALMRHALVRCDQDGLPAYLESSNPRNVSLYKRYGFKVIGAIQVGSSPPIFPMLRKPQRSLF